MKHLWPILEAESDCGGFTSFHSGTDRRVSRREVLHYEASARGPVRGRYTVDRRLRLLLDGEILLYALQAAERKLQRFSSCASLLLALTCCL